LHPRLLSPEDSVLLLNYPPEEQRIAEDLHPCPAKGSFVFETTPVRLPG
jgi:hypothetical protein